jgi:chromodomain-helicase-DNA-binding protein 4
MGCKEVALKPDHPPASTAPGTDVDGGIPMIDLVDSTHGPAAGNDGIPNSRELLFRCLTCKRLAHYAHLAIPSDADVSTDAVNLADYYQNHNQWICSDCSSYVYRVDKILAWRPSPQDAVETDESPNYKAQLPREYLIKWQDRSYRRTQWVPHMWLLSTHTSKLSNFVQGKVARVELLKDPVNDWEDATEAVDNDRTESSVPPLVFGDIIEESTATMPLTDASTPIGADPDAQRKIPPAWKTVDRVLDFLLWTPSKRDLRKKRRNMRDSVISSDAEDSEENFDPEAESERMAIFEQGEEPSDSYTLTLIQWEKRMGRRLNERDIDQVVWIFAKWRNLDYDECKFQIYRTGGYKLTVFSLLGFSPSTRRAGLRLVCISFQPVSGGSRSSRK